MGWVEQLPHEPSDGIVLVSDWIAPAERPRGMAIGVIEATAMVHAKIKVTRNATDFSDTGIPVINPWDR
jgi:toxin FitB